MLADKVVLIALLATVTTYAEAGVAPVVAHAAPAIAHAVPAVAPAVVHAAVAYTNAIPYNIPPYSDRVDIFSKALAVPVAAYAAAPFLHATPVAAGVIPQPVAYAPAAVAAPHAAVPHAAVPHAAAPALPTPLASGVVPPNVLPAYTAAFGHHALPASAYAAATYLKR